MRQKTKKLIPVLLILSSLIILAGLIFMISIFPPDYQINLLNINLPIISCFFVLLFFFIFTLGTFLFKSKTQGFLIGLLIIGFLIFRVNNLTHPFFFILLGALFLTLELLFTYKK